MSLSGLTLVVIVVLTSFLPFPPSLCAGLSENELVGRRLENFAISTGSGVLHELGFSTTAMYFDLMSLMIYLLVTLALAFIVLKVCVREQR
jgi:hypothetical protein